MSGNAAVQGQLTAAQSANAVPAGGIVRLYTAGFSNAALQVQGTYSGTVSFEGSVDGQTFVALNLTPLNSVTAASSTTTTGCWQSVLIGGLVAVQARMSSYTSGVASINLMAA